MKFYSFICWFFFNFSKCLHRFTLDCIEILRYNYFEGYILIALLMVVRRQFLNTVISNFFLVIMLSARVYFHPYVSVESLDGHLAS